MTVTDRDFDRIQDETRAFVLRLRELGCDTARVFFTAMGSKGQTLSFSHGEGNWLAQYAVVDCWVRDVRCDQSPWSAGRREDDDDTDGVG